MATLAPILGTEVAAENPVVQPSVLGGLANLASTVLGASTETSTATPSTPDLNEALVNGLMRAQALREQGQEARATSLERTVRINYAQAGGDIASGDTQDLISSVTGMPAEHLGFSEEEVQFQNVLQTEEFQQYYMGTFASHPDMEDSERTEYAMGRIARAQANAAIIEDTKFEWDNEGGQTSRIAVITDWRTSNMGGLILAEQQGAAISNDMIQEAIVDFQSLRAGILSTRPPNISNEQWKPIADSLQATQDQLDFLLSMTSVEEMSADAIRTIVDGVTASDMGEFDKNLAISMLSNDPSTLVELGVVLPSDLKNVFEASKGLVLNSDEQASVLAPGNGTVELHSPDEFVEGVWAPTLYDRSEDLDPSQGFDRADSLTTLGSGLDITNADSRMQWVTLVGKATASLHAMAADHAGWADAGGYREVFNPSFFTTMQALKDGGHEAEFATVLMQTGAAIDANETAIRAALTSVGRGDIVQWDRETNTLNVDKESLLNSEFLTGNQPAIFSAVLDQHYNGDFDAALRDTMAGRNVGPLWEAFTRGDIDARFASDVLQRVANELVDPQALNRMQALDQLESIRGQLNTIANPEGTGTAASPSIVLGEPTEREKALARDTVSKTSTLDASLIPAHIKDDSAFLQEVNSVADRLGISSNDLMRVMHFETGGSFAPDQRNAAGSGATGLIQFMPRTAEGLGTTTEALASMSRVEQMTFVEAHLRQNLRGVENPTFSDLYMSILWPAAVGKPENFVLWSEGTTAYRQNAGLDINGDGTVTKGEAASRAARSGGDGDFTLPFGRSPETSAMPVSREEAQEPKPLSIISSAQKESFDNGSKLDPAREPVQMPEGSKAASESVAKELLDQLIAEDIDPSTVPDFGAGQEGVRSLAKALREGTVGEGDTIIVEGQMVKL